MAADADRIDPLIFRLASLRLHLGNVSHLAARLEWEIALLGAAGIDVPITVAVLHDLLGGVKEMMTRMEEDGRREEVVLELFPTRSERTEAEREKGGGGGGGGVGESPGKAEEERREWTKDMGLLCGGHDAAEFPGQRAGKEKVVETSTLLDEGEIKIVGGGFLPLNLHDGGIVRRLPQVPMPMPLQLPYTLPDMSSMASVIETSQSIQDRVGDRFFAMHPSSSVRLTRPLSFSMPVYEPQHHQQAGRKPRRCWSEELHRKFKSALEKLGGPETATPKQIRELMKIDGLTNDEVKSHLQKYRINTKKPSSSPSLLLSLRMKHFPDRSPDCPLELPCFSSWNEQRPDSCGYDSDTERGDLQEVSS